jgi:hypothetical protein
MEPSEMEALRKMKPEDVTYMTYEMLHDLKIGPRLRKLEKFQYGLSVAGTVVSGLFALGLLNLRNLLAEVTTKFHHP